MVDNNNDNATSSSLLEAVEAAITNSDQFSSDVVCGSDSDGRKYDTIKEMWQAQGWNNKAKKNDDDNDEYNTNNKAEWYDRAASYYEDNCPATIDGVLGGYASITDLDINGSKSFLNKYLSDRDWTKSAACECGAGLGRVSKGLLLPLGVTSCHLVESSSRLLSEAPNYIGDPDSSRCKFILSGLQDWEPATSSYTIIWIQWVLCYLTDEDAVSFLKRCGKSLCDGGVICMKENTCEEEVFVIDSDDASIARSLPYLLKLIDEAGLRVIAQEMQNDFPDEIYPVPIIALECKERESDGKPSLSETD